MARYFAAASGQLSYAIETTAYSEEGTIDKYFGIMREDITPPNPNPHTPMATGGARRGPHVLSPDPREYEFDIVYDVLDHLPPFQTALGKLTTTAKDPDATASSGDEYNEHLFEEADTLKTMSVQHDQDGELKEAYVGVKTNLNITAERGEPVTATQSAMAAQKGTEDTASPSAPALGIPQDKAPFRFWMLDPISVTRTSDGSSVWDLQTASSLDLSWDNGLEAQHHNDDQASRDAYSVAETTSEEKYDMTVSAVIEDLNAYNEASQDNAITDWEIPFVRALVNNDNGNDIRTDALIITLKECKVTSAPVPSDADTPIDHDITLQPRDTTIAIHEPT